MYKVLFIMPYKYPTTNSPGIAFLRGYLNSRKIKTAYQNFNVFISRDEKYKNIFDFLFREIKDLYNHNISINKEQNDEFENYFIREALGIIKRFSDDRFELIISRGIEKYKEYDVVAFSISNFEQFIFSLVVAKFIKSQSKSKKIVFGGIYITRCNEDIVNLLSNFQIVDYLILGEGEIPLRKICEQNPKIDNSFYLSGKNYLKSDSRHYTCITNDIATPVYEKNEIPFLFSSRKCYWGKCAYCDHLDNSFTDFVGLRSTINVYKDFISAKKESGLKYFCFCDNSLSISFLNDFSEHLINKNNDNKYTFFAFVRPENLINEVTAKKARKAGFKSLSIGLETLSPLIYKHLNRGIDFSDAARRIKICVEAGIRVTVQFMIGLPGETEDDIRKLSEFIINCLNDNKHYIFHINTFCLPRGHHSSVNYKFVEKYGEVIGFNRFLRSHFSIEYNRESLGTGKAYKLLCELLSQLSGEQRKRVNLEQYIALKY